MKRRHILLMVMFAGILISVSSCKKYLDAVPSGILVKDSIFNSLTNTQGYLAQVYANIPQEFDNETNGSSAAYSGAWTAASDDANNFNHAGDLSNQLNQSTWNIDIGGTIWTNFYKPVRTATDFIQNVDKANPNEVSAFLRTHFKGEARALRAIFYFWMLRMYGPIVILPNSIDANAKGGSEIYYPRTPFDSCVQYIVGQLDSAYAELQSTDDPSHPASKPLVLDNVVQYGRVTTGVCKAYKEQVLLLAASPLFNGNTDYAGLKNPDGTQLIPQNRDINKWKLAAQAAKAFIDEFVPGTYDLYKETGGDAFMNAYNSCRNVVINDWNKEWIFGRAEDGYTNTFQSDISPALVGFTNVGGGKGFLSANQSLVDAFFMNNGLPIEDRQSGYQNDGFSDFKAPFDVKARRTFNQWINREPRFYVNITYNNSYWINQGSGDKEVLVDYTFNGNSGRQQSTTNVSSTGYNVRKFLRNGSGNLGFCFIRLAQIYLDYAEALNEYDPGNADIVKYLNLIRERAGIPVYGSGDIPIPATQSAMRTAIRRERQVELANECVRYFDARRWKIAPQTIGQDVYGMDMSAQGDAFYTKTLVQRRRFLQRDYLWPIPHNEILKDNLLVQNPGW